MTHIHVTIPDVRCVSCRKMGSPSVDSVFRHYNDPALHAHVRLPDGWVSLNGDPIGGQPKRLAMCGTCFSVLPSIDNHPVELIAQPIPPEE